MKTFLDFYEDKVKEPTGDLKTACWKGYTAVGTKKKNGRTVPNCVPVSEAEDYIFGNSQKPTAYSDVNPSVGSATSKKLYNTDQANPNSRPKNKKPLNKVVQPPKITNSPNQQEMPRTHNDLDRKHPMVPKKPVVEEVLNLEETNFSNRAVSIYPHGQGSDVGSRVPTSKPTQISTSSAVGNEQHKNRSFFNSPEKKDYIEGMVNNIKSGKTLPPVMSTPHPANPSKNIVVDGNHRAFAHKEAGASHIPAVHVSHDNIHIASHDYEHPDQSFHPLSSFKSKDGTYDMHKRRPQLGGKPLKHYFTEEVLTERGADSKGYKRPTEQGAGLTAKGAKHFGVQTAVTGKVKAGSKAAKRRKSFCARMSGMKGPMKDEKGRPTRKAMSLRRWRCR